MFRGLETERLCLKNIGMEDADFILEEFSDDDINRYLFDAEPMRTLQDAVELIQFYEEPEPRYQHRWILIRKSDGVKMGTCGFHCMNLDSGCVEVGYEMKKEFRGNGYMEEALQAILAFAEEELLMQEVQAVIYPENKRSIHLVSKLGFKESSQQTECEFRGKKYTHVIYQKLLLLSDI